MSRNEGRLGSAEDLILDDESPLPVAAMAAASPETISPTFNWAIPTDMVDLPSRGKFYPEGHPLRGRETIEIKFMTAKEEDILTSPALLKEGIAVDRVLENLILDPAVKVKDMLLGDKNALVVAARISGYGEEYETNVTCPSCNSTESFVFGLSNGMLNDYEQAIRDNNVEQTEDGTFVVQLPLSKVNVEFRLLTGADELNMFKQSQRSAKRKGPSSTLTTQLMQYIVSVNGDSSAIAVSTFVNAMPARDSKYLRSLYSKITPDLDLKQIFECGSCGYSADMEVPLTADFFWPK
jgi:hypothetical protein